MESHNSLVSFSSVREYTRNAEPAWVCTLVKKDGSEIRKKVSDKDYCNMIAGSVVIKDDRPNIRIGKLPPGYMDGAVGENGFSCIFRLPARVRPFKYYENQFLLPFPELLVMINVSSGRVSSASLFALKEKDREKSEPELFNYPFGNVNASGSICFGNIFAQEKLSLREPADLVIVMDRFFSAQTNNDYWYKKEKVRGSSKIDGQKDLVKHLEGMDEFPEKMLVSSKVKYKDLLARL